MIKKYKTYIINEKVDDYVINIMDAIRSIIVDIKIGESFIDLIKDFGISFKIKIELNNIDKFPLYNSNISIKEILKNNFKNFIIEFSITDVEINKNKFFSILSHELSHVYQLLNDPDDKYFDSFNKMINIENFKNKSLEYKYDFLDYIYYNFIHELDARVNQSYEAYIFIKKDNFDDLWKHFVENSELYKMLQFINNFDHKHLIRRWDINELFVLTNQFNILYGIDEININKIENYYQNWQMIFIENSKKYIDETKKAIYQSFHRKERYNKNETKINCYDENILHSKRNFNIDEEILLLVDKFKKLPL